MRVLFLLMPSDKSDALPLPLACFAAIYYRLRDAGIEVVLTSRSGGPVTLDPASPGAHRALASRFNGDRAARDELADTVCGEHLHLDDFAGAVILGPIDEADYLNGASPVSGTLHSLFGLGYPLVLIPTPLAQPTSTGLLMTSSRYEACACAADALLGALGAPHAA